MSRPSHAWSRYMDIRSGRTTDVYVTGPWEKVTTANYILFKSKSLYSVCSALFFKPTRAFSVVWVFFIPHRLSPTFDWTSTACRGGSKSFLRWSRWIRRQWEYSCRERDQNCRPDLLKKIRKRISVRFPYTFLVWSFVCSLVMVRSLVVLSVRLSVCPYV